MEASGTGNMKFMMNGAVTIGTYDGANIEIFEAVGEGNFIPFGLTVPEVLELRKNNSYDSREFLSSHKRLSRVIYGFINSFPNEVGRAEFPHIYDSMTAQNDYFLVMKDFDAYVAAQQQAGALYKDKDKWAEVAATNIAQSGIFSSDEVIRRYASDIWRVW
jgi:starch phosphorylase